MAPHISAGTHQGRAVKGALGETSTGREQVGVEFALLDADGTENPDAPHITWFGFFTEKTLPTTLKALRTMGWKGNDLEDLTGIDANTVELVVEHEEYNGNVTAKVRWINPLNGGGMKAALAPDKAKAFAARMRQQIAAFDASSALPKATVNTAKPKAAKPPKLNGGGPPEPPPHTDSDSGLPF